MIEVKNVDITQGKNLVFTDLNFTIKEGQIICILGASGSGKTTLLKTLLGLHHFQNGSIRYFGKGAQEYFKDNRIPFVSQKYSYFPWLTVSENLALAKRHEKERALFVQDVLRDIGLSHVRDTYVHELSGGMQQRVAIGRALLQKSSILALDEPFGALDTETRLQMQEFLLQQVESSQQTTIMVTHDVEEALFLADRILILGGHPSGIVQDFLVPFERPRRLAMRFTHEFEKTKRFLYASMYTQSMQSTLERTRNASTSKFTKLGLYIWAGSMPFFAAKAYGLFEKYNMPVELISYIDNQQKVQDLKEGRLDFAQLTLDTVMDLERNSGIHTDTFPLTLSKGADALLAAGGINTISELKGKKVAVTEGDFSHFFLSYILRKHEMSPDSVEIVTMPVDQIPLMLIAGEIDAGIVWEPWLTRTRLLMGGTILASSFEYPILYDVMACSAVLPNQQFHTILKRVWDEARTLYLKHPKTVLDAAAPLMGISKYELLEQLEFLDILPSSCTIPPSVYSEIRL